MCACVCVCVCACVCVCVLCACVCVEITGHKTQDKVNLYGCSPLPIKPLPQNLPAVRERVPVWQLFQDVGALQEAVDLLWLHCTVHMHPLNQVIPSTCGKNRTLRNSS